ncbi:MAG TPA: epoxyqueuosine reductase QueH [Clostridiales bacterium]|jgi:epoxyqueuosine reductase|nr:epoxyqueuosine reductase QueH [Clostridiales bacterium]HQP69552.1 epoxyqueuosine reductase QueH [Clostridiales bacterium]
MNSPVNYQKILEIELKKIKDLSRKPKLLLHACCAPCSSYVIEYLKDHFEISVYFYNPNIYPENEYYTRLDETRNFLQNFPAATKIDLLEGDYNHEEFLSIANDYQREAEGGKRCLECFRLRLERTAQKASELKFDYFTTTLTISPHKNAAVINAIGSEISDKYKVRYLMSDFKKNSGFKRSIELSGEYGLYRQDYCGCEFSVRSGNPV